MTHSVRDGNVAIALRRIRTVPLHGWWFIMRTGHKPKHPLEEGLEHINEVVPGLVEVEVAVPRPTPPLR